MKNLFPGFYSPSKQDYQRLGKDGLVVLDTNILLALYRYSEEARNEYLKVLKALGKRLWIPHQVALEFHMNRALRIHEHRKTVDASLKEVGQLVEQLCAVVNKLQHDPSDTSAQRTEILEGLIKTRDDLIAEIERTHTLNDNLLTNDPIRDALDEILEGKIGPAPDSQQAIDEILKDVDHRYLYRIPPGYLDNHKEKSLESTFVFNGIVYEKKYGDVILWKQLIKHLQGSKDRVVLFITADSKEDWWFRPNGKTVGPQCELIQELKREADVEIFWMYNAKQFLEHAKTYQNAVVSAKTMEVVDQVAQTPNDPEPMLAALEQYRRMAKMPALQHGTCKVIANWFMQNQNIKVHYSDKDYLDFEMIAETAEERWAVDVRERISGEADHIARALKNQMDHLLSRAQNCDCDRVIVFIVCAKGREIDLTEAKKRAEKIRNEIDKFLLASAVSKFEVNIGAINSNVYHQFEISCSLV